MSACPIPKRIGPTSPTIVVSVLLIAIFTIVALTLPSGATPSAEADLTRILVMMPMTNLDDFELAAISSKLDRLESVALEYAAAASGVATSHSSVFSIEIDD